MTLDRLRVLLNIILFNMKIVHAVHIGLNAFKNTHIKKQIQNTKRELI